MKRKFDEIMLDTHEEEENDAEPSPLNDIEDWTFVDDGEKGQDTPLIERFWQLLEAAGYECW